MSVLHPVAEYVTSRTSSRRLADGREIIYFDSAQITDALSVERLVEDLRGFPPKSVHSELRPGRLLDEWVIVASHRQSLTYHPPC